MTDANALPPQPDAGPSAELAGGTQPDAGTRIETAVADYTESVVPASARRSNFRMLLTFGSMQLVFGAVLVGYDARFEGLSLTKLTVAMAIAAVTMTVYCIGSANVGAVVGQTHAVTTRGVFGTFGSALVSLLLVIDGMGFYLFTVLLVITLGQALLGTIAAVSTVTALLAFVMIVNNYFGFTGLQRFAQFVAVPVVILWGLYATIKAFTSVSGTVFRRSRTRPVPRRSSSSSGRWWASRPGATSRMCFATPSRARVLVEHPDAGHPVCPGAFLFPIMGYMIATLADQPDFAPSIKYFASFTLFGVGALMMIVLLVNQWAVQDGNLYIAINGAQNLLSRIPRWRRQYTVLGLGLLAAGLTFILPNLTKTFNIVTGIGAVTVPVASTIMAMDVFVFPRLFGFRRPLHRVATWHELAFANWPGIVALLAGTAVGAFTGGLVPGTSGFGKTYIGFPALQAWVTGAVVYLILGWVVALAAKPRARALLGYSALDEAADEAAAASAAG